jgi:hypothetical protein
MPQNETPARAGHNSRNGDVERTADEIRRKFLRDNAGEGASHRVRGIAVVATDTSLSKGARLTYLIRSLYANGAGRECSPGRATLAALLGDSERGIRRYDSELREAGYLSIKRQRRDHAVYDLITPEALQNIIAELLPPDQEWPNLAVLNGQERPRMATQGREMEPRVAKSGPKSGQPCPPTLERYPNKRESARAKNGGQLSEADAALVLYNAAARQHGWSVCETFTASRRKRLEKRLADIGGIDPFRAALSAIPSDDFLMGKRPPKNGGKPFKLDLDRLCQTDGRMGDVLARLIDAAKDAQPCIEQRVEDQVKYLLRNGLREDQIDRDDIRRRLLNGAGGGA